MTQLKSFLDEWYSPEEVEKRQKVKVKQQLLVWYGISRQNKIRKKRGICIIFQNSRYNTLDYYELRVKRYMDICYVREQTLAEKKDAAYPNRIFTKWEMFLDEKPYNGNWEAMLHDNSMADRNNVSENERAAIRNKLEEGLRKSYGLDVPYQGILDFS